LREYARENVAPHHPDLWPAIRARVGPGAPVGAPPQAFRRRLLTGGVGAGVLLLILGAGALALGGAFKPPPLSVSTAEVPDPAANPTLPPGGLHSAHAVELVRSRNDGSAPFSEGRREWWFQAPNNRRIETTFPAPDGTQQYLLSGGDGAARYLYGSSEALFNEFRLYLPTPALGFVAPDLPAAIAIAKQEASLENIYNDTLIGSEPVAGRLAYVVELTIKPGLIGSHDIGLSAHRKRVWIDQEFYTLLSMQAWDAQDNLISESRVEQFTINQPVDAAVFTFTSPPGAVVADMRLASADDRAARWDGVARQFALPLFAPSTPPDGLALGQPYYDRAQGIVSQVFVQGAERRSGGEAAVVLLQGSPSAPLLAESRLGAGRPVQLQIGSDEGRLYYKNRVSTLVVDREGTRILLYMDAPAGMSQARQRLLEIVQSLQPVPAR
jgi:outer membrane lipoprotein-sorting protein